MATKADMGVSRRGWRTVVGTLALDIESGGHRRAVLNLYFALRLVLVTVGFILLAFINIARAKSLLWDGWCVFTAWSLILLLLLALRKRRTVDLPRIEDLAVLFSLPIDALAIYLAASGSGGAASPFYRSVYLLIAVHCYHLVPPRRPGSGRTPLRQLVLMGGLPAVVVSMVVYTALAPSPITDVTRFVEFGLQVLMASAFVLLAFRNLRQSSDLESTKLHLDRAEALRQRLQQSLEDVHALAAVQSRELFQAQLTTLIRNLGETLGFEYVALGRCEGDNVTDTVVWIADRNLAEVESLLEQVRVSPSDGSLVGTIIKRYGRTFSWSEEQDGPLRQLLGTFDLALNDESAPLYRDILPSGCIKELVIVPFYSRPVAQGVAEGESGARGVGYLHLINRIADPGGATLHRFGEKDKAILDTIGRQLSIAIENFESHQKELNQQAMQREKQREEEFLHNLAFEPERDGIFREILSFLNVSLDSRVGSLWFPVQDGFEGEPHALRLVLRTVVVSGGEVEENQALEEKLSRNYLVSPEETIIGGMLKDDSRLTEIDYIPDLGAGLDIWATFRRDIGTSRLVAVPVLPYPQPSPTETKSPPWQRLLAILCLRPRSDRFELTEEAKERLWRFARHMAIVIEQARLKRRNNQIESLIRDQIEAAPVEDPRRFYDRLVHMVSHVMESESCTLFLVNPQTGRLALKATTAAAFLRMNPNGQVDRIETSAVLDTDIYSPVDDRGITVESFTLQSAVLIYNTLQHPRAGRQFMDETPPREPRSLLAAPIVTADGRAIGVLRCTNPRKQGRLLPTFVQADKEFLILLAGILSRLIESAQWNEEKKKFLIRLAHELTTPLSTAEQHIDFVEHVIHGDRRVKDPDEHVGFIRDNLTYLTYLIRDIQLQFGNLGRREKYEYSKAVDLRPMIEKIKKLLLDRTRIRLAVDIRTITADMPALFVDAMRLEQVIFNLVDNAIKYSHMGAHDIVVKYERTSETIQGHVETDWHCIKVQNWGIGVLKGEEESVFREYTRGSNSYFSPSGTGLGLAVSRQIVENHGGALCLTHRQWPTVFAVFLPAYLSSRRPSYEDTLD